MYVKKQLQDVIELSDKVLQELDTLEHTSNSAARDPQVLSFFSAYRSFMAAVSTSDGKHISPSLNDALAIKSRGGFKDALIALTAGDGYSKEQSQRIRKYLPIVRHIIAEACTGGLRSGKIFYSWQSDSENTTNRGFIGTSLEKAVKELSTTGLSLSLDSDTRGMPGSPDITNTILCKITEADVFVADVSLVGEDLKPNSNVIFELGYALGVLGEQRIIMVFNEAFGVPKDLPFDLGFKRQVLYKFSVDGSNKAEELRKLATRLKGEIAKIINSEY